MDAIVVKLSAEQIMNLAGALILAGFAAVVLSALLIRSAVVGYAFYKYRAKKRRPMVSVETVEGPSREARPLPEPSLA